MDIYTIGIYIAYALVAIAVISVVVGLIMGLMQDMKSGIFTIGAIVAILVVFGIAYAVSEAELTQKLATKGFNMMHMKLFTGAVITFYVLFVLAWIALIYDLAKNLIQGN